MPTRNPTPCATPGCPNLAKGRTCSGCSSRRRKAKADGRDSPYLDPAWIACSRAFLKANPRCAHRACPWPATEAHHIDGLGPRGPLGLAWSNLLPVCKSHHAQITGRTRGFGSPARTS